MSYNILCIIDDYLDIKNNEILPFPMKWVDLHDILLSEISHT